MRAIATLMLVALPAVAPGQQDRARDAGRETPSSATPAEPAAKDAPPGAARDLARALLPQARWDRLLDGYASALSVQVSQALLGRGEDVPDDLKGRLRGLLGERLRYDETVHAQAEALADRFTTDEMSKALVFYSSPVGAKVVERMPEAQADVGEQLQARLATAVPEIVKQVAPAATEPSGAASSGAESDNPPRSGAQGRRPPTKKE